MDGIYKYLIRQVVVASTSNLNNNHSDYEWMDLNYFRSSVWYNFFIILIRYKGVLSKKMR
jgi:hypothetical protein